jgi:hypothetical protein
LTAHVESKIAGECSMFLQDMSVYFLAEYSDDRLYGECFGWNIFETLEQLYSMRRFLTVLFVCILYKEHKF